MIDPTGELSLPGAAIGIGLNLIAQVGTCLALGGDFATSLKCVDLLDIALSWVKGAMGMERLALQKFGETLRKRLRRWSD
jgi:hypothetical protein